jgi:hypothetical protein
MSTPRPSRENFARALLYHELLSIGFVARAIAPIEGAIGDALDEATYGRMHGGACPLSLLPGETVEERLRPLRYAGQGARLAGARVGAGVVLFLDLLERLRMLALRFCPDRLAGEGLADRRLEFNGRAAPRT